MSAIWTTQWCIILSNGLKFAREVAQTERVNLRGSATKKAWFSRTSWLRNLHNWVYLEYNHQSRNALATSISSSKLQASSIQASSSSSSSMGPCEISRRDHDDTWIMFAFKGLTMSPILRHLQAWESSCQVKRNILPSLSVTKPNSSITKPAHLLFNVAKSKEN